MRARMALDVSGYEYEHREIVLRDKPDAMLRESPKGTVPVLVVGGQVFEESLDIMRHALAQNDPEGWLDFADDGRTKMWLDKSDAFKPNLDRYKYTTRYPDADKGEALAACKVYLDELEQTLSDAFLLGDKMSFCDVALFAFVRQFHFTNPQVLDDDYPNVKRWLFSIIESERFMRIMKKHPLYES